MLLDIGTAVSFFSPANADFVKSSLRKLAQEASDIWNFTFSQSGPEVLRNPVTRYISLASHSNGKHESKFVVQISNYFWCRDELPDRLASDTKHPLCSAEDFQVSIKLSSTAFMPQSAGGVSPGIQEAAKDGFYFDHHGLSLPLETFESLLSDPKLEAFVVKVGEKHHAEVEEKVREPAAQQSPPPVVQLAPEAAAELEVLKKDDSGDRPKKARSTRSV